MTSLPQEVARNFELTADLAVEALRRALQAREQEIPGRIAAIIEDVFMFAIRSEVQKIAADEFERLGRAHVRKIVLEVFDKFVTGADLKGSI